MIKRDFFIFLFVGGLTVSFDFLAYQGLILTEAVDVGTAKAFGFVAGSLFSYFANRIWTFGRKKHVSGSVWRFCVVYVSTLVVNVFVNSLALMILIDVWNAIQAAFVIATGASAALNFLGMKYFVFKAEKVGGQQ